MTPPRNVPCPCGSGRKYKKCCGRDASPSKVKPFDDKLTARFCADLDEQPTEVTALLLGSLPEANILARTLGVKLKTVTIEVELIDGTRHHVHGDRSPSEGHHEVH
jgi:hypothetical protein